MITNHIFFLKILKAVCLSVNWVPKLIQKFCPTMEQKLVQCVRLRSLQMLAMPRMETSTALLYSERIS